MPRKAALGSKREESDPTKHYRSDHCCLHSCGSTLLLPCAAAGMRRRTGTSLSESAYLVCQSARWATHRERNGDRQMGTMDGLRTTRKGSPAAREEHRPYGEQAKRREKKEGTRPRLGQIGITVACV